MGCSRGVAGIEGVEVTVRALRLDRLRLEARIAKARSEIVDKTGSSAFVELDARQLGLSSRTIVRLEGRDGERLEVELGPGTAIDIAALAEAFWGRRG